MIDMQWLKVALSKNSIYLLQSGKEIFVPSRVEEPSFIVSSSGSLEQKNYVHTWTGIKNSCESFLSEFEISTKDSWGLCLSTQHVAGFSVLCRSYIGNLKEPTFFSWSTENLKETLKNSEVSLFSFVPTQIYDICHRKIKCPPHVKYVFVGGAALSEPLFKEAKALGWPLILSYGSTETFAQMASSEEQKGYKPFKGWSVSLSEEGELLLKGPGIFDSYWNGKSLQKREGEWFKSGDLVKLVKKNQFKVLSKMSGRFKIKGSYFDFYKLKKEIQSFTKDSESIFPVALEEARNGVGLYLISEKGCEYAAEEVLKKFKVLRGVYFLESLPKSLIGKISKKGLEDALSRKLVSH